MQHVIHLQPQWQPLPHIAVAAALPCPAATGDPYPKSTEEVCKAADAVLLASIGGCAVLRCAVLCCAVEESAKRPMPCCWRPSAGALRCAALCCAVLCCGGDCKAADAVLLAFIGGCAVLRCAALCCAEEVCKAADAVLLASIGRCAALCCMLWQRYAVLHAVAAKRPATHEGS